MRKKDILPFATMWMDLEGVKLNQIIQTVKANTVSYYLHPGLIPGLGRSPGEGNGNPLQCSCLENPRDEGAWWHRVGHD